jgi:hypothetical protein
MIEKSELYKVINSMPKMGIHHIHLGAACPISFLIELSKEDIVYFSETQNVFKVYPKEVQIEQGFIKVNELRNSSNSVK